MEPQTAPQIAFEISWTTKKPSLPFDEFDKIFLDSVDAAFSMLGNSAKQAMFNYIDRKLGGKNASISSNIEAFSVAVNEVFGQAAPLIEMKIMKDLHARVPNFKFSVRGAGLSFLEYVEALRAFV